MSNLNLSETLHVSPAETWRKNKNKIKQPQTKTQQDPGGPGAHRDALVSGLYSLLHGALLRPEHCAFLKTGHCWFQNISTLNTREESQRRKDKDTVHGRCATRTLHLGHEPSVPATHSPPVSRPSLPSELQGDAGSALWATRHLQSQVALLLLQWQLRPLLPKWDDFSRHSLGGKRAIKLHGLKRVLTSEFNGIYNSHKKIQATHRTNAHTCKTWSLVSKSSLDQGLNLGLEWKATVQDSCGETVWRSQGIPGVLMVTWHSGLKRGPGDVYNREEGSLRGTGRVSLGCAPIQRHNINYNKKQQCLSLVTPQTCCTSQSLWPRGDRVRCVYRWTEWPKCGLLGSANQGRSFSNVLFSSTKVPAKTL